MADEVKLRVNDRQGGRVVLLLVLLAVVVAWGVLERARPRPAPANWGPPKPPETRVEMHQGKAIRVTTDVPYAYSPIIPAEELSLDLYVPEGAQKAPILVYLHGGGWIGGNKNGIGPKAMTFAASGMIVASVNCRLAPVRPAPNACSDIAEAIALLRHMAGEIGGDRDRLVLMGHSAGAHLAALTVCDERYLAPHPGAAAAIRGLVLLDGSAYHVPRMMRSFRAPIFEGVFSSDFAVWRETSPYHFARSRQGLPKMLLVHAGDDELRYQAATDLASAVSRGGGEAVLLPAPTKDHYSVDIDLSDPADPITRQVMEFIREVTQTTSPAE